MILRLTGELDDQNRVLRRQPDQNHQADLDQDIAIEAARVHPQHRRENAHRHDQHHRERQQPALVQRRQQQEHERHRQPEGDHRRVAGELLLQRDLRPFEAEALRQPLLGDRLDRGDRLAGGEPARQAQLHLGRRIQIVARHAERPRRVAEGRHGTDRHHVAVVVARLQVLDVALAQPERIVRLRGYLIGAARAG